MSLSIMDINILINLPKLRAAERQEKVRLKNKNRRDKDLQKLAKEYLKGLKP